MWFSRRKRRRREAQTQQAIEEFSRSRDQLQQMFFSIASQSGKPRGLRWVSAELGPKTAFAQDRQSQQLRSLAEVTIRFEAIEGGDMEEVEAVGNLRAATAVFYYADKQWKTDGRVVYNLSPRQTIHHFAHELDEIVDRRRNETDPS